MDILSILNTVVIAGSVVNMGLVVWTVVIVVSASIRGYKSRRRMYIEHPGTVLRARQQNH